MGPPDPRLDASRRRIRRTTRSRRSTRTGRHRRSRTGRLHMEPDGRSPLRPARHLDRDRRSDLHSARCHAASIRRAERHRRSRTCRSSRSCWLHPRPRRARHLVLVWPVADVDDGLAISRGLPRNRWPARDATTPPRCCRPLERSSPCGSVAWSCSTATSWTVSCPSPMSSSMPWSRTATARRCRRVSAMASTHETSSTATAPTRCVTPWCR